MAVQLWLNDEDSTHSQKDDIQDLFVFGYACKIFRNDDKALYVDKGKHLIPWMGNDSLMIDRYDGRGHLYDLSSCDADNENIDRELSEEEANIEKLCDEERYLELNTDIAEKTVYEEEEWKRYQEALQTGYQAVGFSYEQPKPCQDIYHQDEYEAEEEKPFIPMSKLNIPDNLELPSTIKMNAVIEKTANFIAEHGTQMEIVLKAKQALNSQFDFLDYNNPLNGYYKYMVKIIKSGKYVPKSEPSAIERQDSQEDNHHHEHGYLHKSIAPSKIEPTKAVKVPVVSIHDTPYGQLVKSIKRHNIKEPEPDNSYNSLAPPAHAPQYIDEQQDISHTHSHVPPDHGVEQGPLPRHHADMSVSNDNKMERRVDDTSPIVPPPPDIQPIVDRMAMYVAKNGSEFEMVVRSKNDARFQFLNDWHVHYRYYDFKKTMFQKELLIEKKEKEEATAALLTKGVSFSIKTRTKESDSVAPLKKSLFDYGSSENGDSDSDKGDSSSSPATDNSRKKEHDVVPDVLEDVDDKKAAESKLMNRLATAARDKLAQTSKDKQMQAERKRKAAMFISMLKGKPEADNSKRNEKVVFDYGHSSKLRDVKSHSGSGKNGTSRSITPPLSFSNIRRSSSRSPSRKSFHSRDVRDSRRPWSPFSRYQKSSRLSPKRRNRSSPKRSTSPKYRSRSPRHSPRRQRSSSKSKSRSRHSRSSSKSSFRSRQELGHSQSKERNVNNLDCMAIGGFIVDKNLPVNDLTDPSKLPELTTVVIKQEKVDPVFENIANSTTSSSASMSGASNSNSDNVSTDSGGKDKPDFHTTNKNVDNESQSENNVQSENRNEKRGKSPRKKMEESEDDVEIVDVPVIQKEELSVMVDLTELIDSEPETDYKKALRKKRKKSRTRSPYAKKRSRSSRSRSPISRRRKRSHSPSSRQRKSRSRSPRRRSKSPSFPRKSSHSKLKTSKKHLYRSKSRSPKHRRQSPIPKRRNSRTPVKRSHRDKSRSVSPHRKSSKAKTAKYKKRSSSRSKSKSPDKKRSRTPKAKKKKHKSPSRSPKLHKKKKNKDKDRTKEKKSFTESKVDSRTKFDILAEKEMLKEHLKMVTKDRSTPEFLKESNDDSQDANLLNKVRAMLKASRDAMKTDDVR